MKSYKQHFSRFLQSKPERLHFAAHSHHLWPDVSLAAQEQCWLDAAEAIDGKWGRILGEVMPEAQAHVARILELPEPSSLCFAGNTHELVLRLHSCLPRPARILTTDAEFHSFLRQRKRWEEAGEAVAEVVAAEPFESFGERFLDAARSGEHEMVYLSQVFFNSGYRVEILEELAEILRERDTLLVIDGYHAFMAVPFSLAGIAERAFFLAGGYKYAMSGEGVCFLHCPPGLATRPVNTGWFAGFEGLQDGVHQVGYADDGQRFAGSTFDASGLYRFNAVQRWLGEIGLDVAGIHQRVQSLQARFLDALEREELAPGELIPGRAHAERGHFLTFRSERAADLQSQLAARQVIVDSRGDRLRFGFGIYHDPDDVDALIEHLRALRE